MILLELACMMFFIAAFWRLNELAEYRSLLIDRVALAARDDVEEGRDYEWRYEAFSRVTFGEMHWKFWRSFDSFYPDKSFVRRIGGDAE